MLQAITNQLNSSLVKKLTVIFVVQFSLIGVSFSQTTFNATVNAGTSSGTIEPIWRDHYETQLMTGYGGNPTFLGPHTSIVIDPNFSTEMNRLKPRFIRVSIGRLDNPSDTSYYSMDTSILKNLPFEFYKGANNLSEANNLANYNFTYVDSMIRLVQSIGAEPFLTMDYMPFTLSSIKIPQYSGLLFFLYNLAYDNKIRNSPPANNAVYGRVMYHLIKHCYDNFGVNYFEHWNEPDQNIVNPKFFWNGTEPELYASYAAIATEVSADANLANNVKLGGCSFALYSNMQEYPINFLQKVQTNGTKFDFLSFHPYSDTQFKGGYDSAKVSMVQSWISLYVPSAELINGEWGRIDQNSDTWGDLDYGLNKVEHIIDMLNRNVTKSFNVSIFDPETSTDNYLYLGMYRVGPIVPKPTAYVFYNMNKMNDALNSIPFTASNDLHGIAGVNDANDKIVIAIPAPLPISGTNTINLSVNNLPWGNGNYYVNRFELTDASYQLGIIENLTLSKMESGTAFMDTVNYTEVNNSGRLIVWEISKNPLATENLSIEKNEMIVFPNPASKQIMIQFNESPKVDARIILVDAFGRIVYTEDLNEIQKSTTIQPELKSGFYILTVRFNGINHSERIFIRH